MTHNEYRHVCANALALGLTATSTEFWSGQRASGLEPITYFNRLAEVKATAELLATHLKQGDINTYGDNLSPEDLHGMAEALHEEYFPRQQVEDYDDLCDERRREADLYRDEI